MCVCVCVYIYIYIYEIPLYTKMYSSRFKINSMFYSCNTRNKPDLFQAITPNYLKRVSLNNSMLI